MFRLRGEHSLRATSSTQTGRSLSSEEAEFMALVRHSTGLGFVAMSADVGLTFRFVLETNSLAAKGVASMRGIGRMRHALVATVSSVETASGAEDQQRRQLDRSRNETSRSSANAQMLDAMFPV